MTDTSARALLLRCAIGLAALAPTTSRAADEPSSSSTQGTQGTAHVFSLDIVVAPRTHLGNRTGADDFTELHRVGFWGKDALFGSFEDPAKAPVLFGAARAAEFVLLDFPLAINAQTLAHEIDGHGGRVREFGGEASLMYRLPFPYGLETSTFPSRISRATTPDEDIMVYQGGLVLEGYQRRRTLLSAYESGTLSHGDQVLFVGWALHMFGYGLSRNPAGDVAGWTTALARATGSSQRAVQQQFLISAAIAELGDPLFLYSAYALFYRFLAIGERRQAAPTLRAFGVPIWPTTHLEPVPWGVELELGLVARPQAAVFAIAPRYGTGSGGSSAGVTVDMKGFALGSSLRLSAETTVWLQPRVNVFSEGRWTGPAPAVSAVGPARASRPGMSVDIELTYEYGPWIQGIRLGAKTEGVNGIDPVSPSVHAGALVGVRLP